jgi:hypothetical protein
VKKQYLLSLLQSASAWIEGVEAAVVAVAFCASFEQIVKRMNFAV